MEISLNDAVTGNLQTAEDMDYYHIRFKEKHMGRVVFTIPYHITMGMFRITVYRMNSANQMIQVDSVCSGLASTNLGTTLVYVPGDYYFCVTGNNPDSQVNYKIQFGGLDEDAGTISNLTIKLTGAGNLKLNWGKIFTATGYHLYMIKSGSLKKIKTLLGNHNTYIYKIRKAGTYSFLVRPYFDLGNSGMEYETFNSNTVKYKIPKKLKKPVIKIRKAGKRARRFIVLKYNNAKKIYVYAKHGKEKWVKKRTFIKRKQWKIKVSGKGVYRFKFRGYRKFGKKKVYSGLRVKKIRFR